jgi:membrane protein YdbS with pleckstrin-like domain
MRCHACGAEVMETGVYCHKCGARLDMADQGATPPERAEPEAAASESPEVQADETPPSPRERLQEAVAARRNAPDEPEKDLWQGTYSSKAMVGMWVLCGAITIVLLIVGGLWFRNRWLWLGLVSVILLMWLYAAASFAYRRLSVRYRLTSRRFFHEKGILRHVTDRIEVIDMDDIAFEQSIIDRLVGVGTIRISSSDRSDPVLVISGIENVKEVAGMIDEARLSERMRRGLHIESI